MKKLIAILTCLVLVLSFAACGKTESPTPEADDTSVADTTENAPEEVSDETTEAPTDNAGEEPEVTSEAAEDTEETTDAAEPEETSEAAADVKVPGTKAEIVALYNSATAAAKEAKPGYKKSVNTKIENLQMGALAKISVVRTTIADFLGEGVVNTNVAKGKFNGKDLVVSTLTEADVKDAACTLSDDGKYYEVTITVNPEKNLAKKSSALGKFTNDYKDSDEIRAGLVEAGASVGTIEYWTTSVTIKAKISVDDNKFESISHSLRMSAILSDVKYSIAKVSKATTDLNVDSTFTGFAY